MTLRINARAPMALNPRHAFMTPAVAVTSLMKIEDLPGAIFDPCCGDGALLEILRGSGRTVCGLDIHDYGWAQMEMCDYFAKPISLPEGWGIVTNPPYKLAEEFIRKALILDGAKYVAMLMRTNFLESVGRMALWRDHPPARIWISSRRLPMMHRYGYEGPTSTSNVSYAWYIWDERATDKCKLGWFDWEL